MGNGAENNHSIYPENENFELGFDLIPALAFFRKVTLYFRRRNGNGSIYRTPSDLIDLLVPSCFIFQGYIQVQVSVMSSSYFNVYIFLENRLTDDRYFSCNQKLEFYIA
jgi:hypothetical protein